MGVKKSLYIIALTLMVFIGFFGVISATHNVTYDTTMPTCSVDYLKQQYGSTEYLFSDSVYIGKDGYFYVYGDSSDTESNIINVQFNRSSPDISFIFTDTDSVSGGFNSLHENWRTKPYFPLYFINGWHTICCQAKDQANNLQVPGTCQEFCIDTNGPGIVNKPTANGQDCANEEGKLYSNSETISWSWTAPSVDGCAPIKNYEVSLYSNEELVGVYNESSTTFTYDFGINGETYYIEVRARDMAENINQISSDKSDEIIVDTENPVVTIDSPTQGTYFKDDFSVSETDTDTNLLKCYYKITNNGGEPTLDWTETTCNNPINVDVSEKCSEDGTCRVYKKAEDKSCRTDDASKYFYIDRTAPTTTKIISDPKVAKTFQSWVVDWFITDKTTISFTCDDGEGVNHCTTYYKINDGNFTEYEEPISLAEDGVYTVEYYSVDELGNTEVTQIEKDKVDTEAPTTSVSYIGTQMFGQRTIQGVNALVRFITDETEINLTATDTEVGVDKTKIRISVPSTDGNHLEWYGQTTQKWYESTEECTADNNQVCEETKWSDNEWTTYEGPITSGYSEHKVCYYSYDLLGNTEKTICDVFSVDNQAPTILVYNPTPSEQAKVERCTQSIVIEAFDDKTGVNESSIKAELEDSNGSVVRSTTLKKSVYGTYESLMDKALPEGEYKLKIYAEDNLGNLNVVTLNETLVKTVFVEYVSPSSCSISSNNGGSCDFTFNVCMRGGDNNIKFWMNKLGAIVTPGMMNASISYNSTNAFVGLKQVGEKNLTSEAGTLKLSDTGINGRTHFNLHLNMDANVSQSIGIGNYDLEYWIESFK